MILFLVVQFVLADYMGITQGFVVSIGFIFVYLFSQRFVINKPRGYYILPLIGIIILGIMMAILYGRIGEKLFIRELLFYLSPIIYIEYGYIFVKKYQIESVYKALVYSGVISSLVHFLLVIPNIMSMSAGQMRISFGFWSYSSAIALFVVLFDSNYILSRRKKMLLILMLTASLALYFSRTGIVCLLIGLFVFSINNQKKINIIKIVKVLVISVVVGYCIISILPNSQAEWMLNKFINIFEETSTSLIQNWNYETATQHSRGYEKYSAIQLFIDSNYIDRLFGLGFGSVIPIDISLRIGGEFYSELPTIHNMYYNALIKTGLIGLAFLIYYLAKTLYISWCYISSNPFLGKVILMITIWIILEGWVTPGIFIMYSSYILCFCLGCFYGERDIPRK